VAGDEHRGGRAVAIIPVKFDYASPATLDEAIAILADHANAAVLAGGQSLIPAMTVRRVAPSMLVDLRRIEGLRGQSTTEGGTLRIGAATTLDEVAASAQIRSRWTALAEAAEAAGDAQVRNRGTVGGALADGHPAGDVIAAAIALDAVVHVTGRQGTRSIPAADFATGPFATALQPGEIVTSVDVPPQAARSGSAYVKLRHPGSGYAICGVAATVTISADGTTGASRVGITGAADHPVRLPSVEQAIHGKSLAAAAMAAAEAVPAAGLTFGSDLAASAEYRAHLARVLTERAVALAAQRGGTA